MAAKRTAATRLTPADCRARLKRAASALDRKFLEKRPIGPIIRQRARAIDGVLADIWRQFDWPEPERVSLLAVGGYGRQELHPHSDIDVMVLLDAPLQDRCRPELERLVAFLWDSGLSISHSVRTLDECAGAGAGDITVLTNMMEARTVVGPPSMRERMNARIASPGIWPSDRFFQAKRNEQTARRQRYADSEYSLEPNVKQSPGGLRDLQTMYWVAQRRFGARDHRSLIDRGFITPKQGQILNAARNALWRIRYGLHRLTGRCEDRLLFDYQRSLSAEFGFVDNPRRLAVEQFMQSYYRAAGQISTLNEVLMSHFDEELARPGEALRAAPINRRFRLRGDRIEAVGPQVFRRHPSALLEIFVLIAENRAIQGIRASTIGLIQSHVHLIDSRFRADAHNRELFMALLRARHRVALQLSRMRRYGVLGRYLPEFGRVIGAMQHDLFHIYTVDAHTLQVVRNMRRMQKREKWAQSSLAALAARRLPRPELLYIAGLYHDIGKGRGGDHSELGAQDAAAFCERHGISSGDANLVTWLVRHHLSMSHTAQREDIQDPEVQRAFARHVGDERRLNHLYALTVADIRATNPNLWTDWKASLLRQLYLYTWRMLRRGSERPVDRQLIVADAQTQALGRLRRLGWRKAQALEIWDGLDDSYFLHASAEEIAWHADAMLSAPAGQPVALVRPGSQLASTATSNVFACTDADDGMFVAMTSVMERVGINVQDARIANNRRGQRMHMFFVLDRHDEALGDREARELLDWLTKALRDPGALPRPAARRTPRQQRHFAVPIQALMRNEDDGHNTLEVTAPNRRGLLASLARLFAERRLRLKNARINTLGERVEDIFSLTDAAGRAITDRRRCADIERAVCERLTEHVGAERALRTA